MDEEASVMAICQTELEMVEPEQINSVLSSRTRERLVDGQATYKPKDSNRNMAVNNDRHIL